MGCTATALTPSLSRPVTSVAGDVTGSDRENVVPFYREIGDNTKLVFRKRVRPERLQPGVCSSGDL